MSSDGSNEVSVLILVMGLPWQWNDVSGILLNRNYSDLHKTSLTIMMLHPNYTEVSFLQTLCGGHYVTTFLLHAITSGRTVFDLSAVTAAHSCVLLGFPKKKDTLKGFETLQR